MELQYYIDQTPIDQSLIRWMQTSTLSFAGNAIVNAMNQDIAGSNNDTDFTVILTAKRARMDGESLISKYDLSTFDYGFALCYSYGNYLFLKTADGQAFIFDEINLAEKNCLFFKKSGSTFTVGKYDVISSTITQEQVIIVRSDYLNSDGEVYIAGDYGVDSQKWFSGDVEQGFYYADALDKNYLLDILKGFRPESKSSSASNSHILLSYNVRISTGESALQSYFSNYLSGINSVLVTGLSSTGRWAGAANGYLNPTKIESLATLATGLNGCDPGDTLVYSYLYTGAGTSLTGVFSDTVRMTRNSNYVTISHSLELTGNFTGRKKIDGDYVYQYSGITSSSLTTDSGQYSGFYYNGVLRLDSGIPYLYVNTGVYPTGPTGYNKIGSYDNSSSSFLVPGFIEYPVGQIYLNGVAQIGYTLSSGRVTFADPFYSTDEVIYDNSPNPAILKAGDYFWATGDFQENSSVVFRAEDFYRIPLQTGYLETSKYHAYHSGKIQPSGQQLLFTL
jgi:hypothetical protein